MIRTVCDLCDKAIGVVFGDWWAVDHVKLDDDGEIPEEKIAEELHFCSADHLVAYVMEHSYQPTEESS